MSILNVNRIQPVGSGQTVTINAANISAGSATVTAGTFSGNLNSTSGATTVAAGSTSAPSISPSGDSNTGIFFPSADTIAFAEGGVEAARFDSSGRLGIGTNNPIYPLHISGSGETNFILQGNASGSTNPGVYLLLQNKTGQKTTIQALDQSNQGISEINFFGVDDPNNEGYMTFSTRPSGGLMTERARIASGGNISLHGNGDPSSSSTIGVSIQNGATLGTIQNNTTASSGAEYQTFRASGTQIGSITRNGASNVAYNTSSDYRLKENIQQITDATTKIKLLAPKRFSWINDETHALQDGFIAHEVQEVVPEAVTGIKDAINEDGSIKPQGIDHSKLVPLLTAALQEAMERIETLEARLDALENS